MLNPGIGNLIFEHGLAVEFDRYQPVLIDDLYGILFHCTGPHGAFWNVWKQSLKFQVEEKNMGDLYCLAGTSATVPVVKGEKFWTYDPAGELKPFGRITNAMPGRVSHLPGDFEKPNGEWNTLELYTIGQTAVYVVNGKVVQVLRNIRPTKAPSH